MTSPDPIQRMHDRPMGRFQIFAIAICIVINSLDGLDVLVIAFAAPRIADEWGLSPETLGVVFSSGLVGMALGALTLAPLADTFGRRRIIISSLLLISAGMLAAALVTDTAQLIAARALTGFGVGGMLASLNTIVAEYSSTRSRSLAVSLLQSAYPVGAVLGGIISAYLIGRFGWRSLFLLGGGLTLAMLPLVLWRLPESLDYLLSRQPQNALARANDLLQKIGLEPVSEMPPRAADEPAPKSSISRVVGPEFRLVSVSLWCGFFMLMAVWYFIISWTPKLLVDAGLNIEQGISGGVLLSLGGIVGGLVFGYASLRFRPIRMVRVFMLFGGVSMAAFALIGIDLATMMAIAATMGFFVAGSMVGLYALIPSLYPAAVRNTGVGWASGIGRLGAILGPYVAGLLVGAGWASSTIYLLFGAPMLLAVVAVSFIPLAGHKTPVGGGSR
jgi:benzoate transport